ncbi:MAG: DNA polymerase I, partial [Cyclobacteriaceae bacterium]|nr:DNA polymerase I [Cyclobacteriaceae bacterium]
YELVVLKNWDVHLQGKLFDVMLAHYLIDPDLSHTLDMISHQYLHYNILPEYKKQLDKLKRNEKLKSLNDRDILDASCEAVSIFSELTEKLKSEIDNEPLKALYNDMEMPLISVLAEIEYNGVSIDKEVLSKMSKEVGDICNQLETAIFEEAGQEFNVNSPKQLGEILFDKLNLVDKPKKTKTGQYATGEEILSSLQEHKIVGQILEYRELQKLKSTYIDALPNMVSKSDNKIHTNYNQAVAATGRLSSINPNLQNIPVRTERGKLIRKAFIPSSEDYVILSADYSQIELRIMASFSEDPIMVEAFKQGVDIHSTTASQIFSVPIEEVDSAMRRKAKSVNFGLIYGQSAFGLAQNLNISRTEAKEIIDAYFTKFKGVKSYMDQVINEARENEYVETISGRRRYLRDINSRNQTMRGFAERNAINAPIQGSAADIIKLAMIEVQKALNGKGFKSKMIMQVHDELVFEVPKTELDRIKPVIIKCMTEAVKLKVPMEVDCGTGDNWLEAH